MGKIYNVARGKYIIKVFSKITASKLSYLGLLSKRYIGLTKKDLGALPKIFLLLDFSRFFFSVKRNNTPEIDLLCQMIH